MGDRANILVKSENDNIYLYTHWNGSELIKIAQKAMKRRERWTDFQYLTRILFCEMVKGDMDGAIGFGISSKVGDGANRIIKIDTEKQIVRFSNQLMTFEEFCEIKNLDW